MVIVGTHILWVVNFPWYWVIMVVPSDPMDFNPPGTFPPQHTDIAQTLPYKKPSPWKYCSCIVPCFAHCAYGVFSH